MIAFLLLLSGFAALVYQVLWMRDLAVLFGSSAHAAAVVLAVFFGGLAMGAALYARVAPRVAKPLRFYGLLEIGVAASALLFLALLDAYAWVYAPLYQRFAETPGVLIAMKALLAAGVLALPAILMGATLPAMVQHAPARPARLYGMNTLGGTLGAFAAGFFLPPLLGFRGSYALALAASLGAGALAMFLSRRPVPAPPQEAARAGPRSRRRPESAAAGREVGIVMSRGLAFASGALTIGLEVAWLRMFAQVLDNSVYAFSAVVVVALVAFALAAAAVDLTERMSPERLSGVLAICGLAVAAQPAAFIAFTGNLTQIQSDSWLEYVARAFGMAGLFVGVPGFAAGLVFPALLRVVRSAPHPGAAAGRLVALNTAGAITGSLVTTFALLPALGLWATLAAVAACYAMLSVSVAWAPGGRARTGAMLAAGAAAAIGGLALTLPRVSLDRARSERVLAVWDGGHGTVAVTEARDGRVLRMNNSYSLGGTVDRIERERIQALLPLVLHPSPQRVFFLGLGTGITAGEALRHPVSRVVVCELVPEVIDASARYFAEWTRGLADDPRVELRAEDGRQYLAATAESFDVIVSDLFVPWHAGTGMLYTREHFETTRARLRPGGIFAQWLPLFQLGQRDFEVIARTMLEVFPHVAIWRGDFYANRPILALVASEAPAPLDPDGIARRVGHLSSGLDREGALAALLPYYAGNLSAARDVLGPGAVNTDGRPIVEYLSPISQWSSHPGSTPWFVSTPLARFLARVRASVPLDRDPNLAALTAAERGYVEAGAFYYRAIVQSLRDDDEAAGVELAEALRRLPPDVRVSGPFMALDEVVR